MFWLKLLYQKKIFHAPYLYEFLALRAHTSLMTGEGTPSYILGGELIVRRLKALSPHSKLLIMLRYCLFSCGHWRLILPQSSKLPPPFLDWHCSEILCTEPFHTTKCASIEQVDKNTWFWIDISLSSTLIWNMSAAYGCFCWGCLKPAYAIGTPEQLKNRGDIYTYSFEEVWSYMRFAWYVRFYRMNARRSTT